MAYINKATGELTGYSASIAKYTGFNDPDVLDEIEDMMRMNLSGLSHLDKRAFAKLARESAATCIAMGAIAAAKYAASLVEAR